MLDLPDKVTIHEVGLRDGLQLEEKLLSVAEKTRLAEELVSSGIRHLEIGAFVHPKHVPQMANTAEVFRELRHLEGVRFSALIPNLKGAERAAEAGVNEINFVLSASDTHNRKNVNMTVQESLQMFGEIAAYCRKNALTSNVIIGTSFGCPFEGEIAEAKVIGIAENVLAAGAKRVTLADTTGVANPRLVYERMRSVRKAFPSVTFFLHFHNTRGMGLANILAGLKAGVTGYDTALGGIGGCPFAPGATGNVCTEDVVHMLETIGIETGIDLDQLLSVAALLQDTLGHELPSSVLKAGKSSRRYQADDENCVV